MLHMRNEYIYVCMHNVRVFVHTHTRTVLRNGIARVVCRFG